MPFFDLREPISAWSHGTGMMLALPLTWFFWRRCVVGDGGSLSPSRAAAGCRSLYQDGKVVSLLIFGLSLVACYGNSALYHAVWLQGDALNVFRRMDHVGIYLLIAGTYTPVAWAMMPAGWRWRTLLTVWGLAGICAARVWIGGVFSPWASTLVYLTLGWGALFCYRVLAWNYPHRVLFSLPLGGIFYSLGALINVLNRPVLVPGLLGAHEIFHFFVIAGSAFHIRFMLGVVVPAEEPFWWADGTEAWVSSSVGGSVADSTPRAMGQRDQPAPAARPHFAALHSSRLAGDALAESQAGQAVAFDLQSSRALSRRRASGERSSDLPNPG